MYEDRNQLQSSKEWQQESLQWDKTFSGAISGYHHYLMEYIQNNPFHLHERVL